MAVNQYGIDSKLWSQMTPEDQNQVIADWNKAHQVAYIPPTIGGYVQPTQQQVQTAVQQSGLPQTSQDSVVAAYTAATTPPSASGNPKWVFAVNMPSTYPDFAAMKNAGAGLVVVDSDPNAAMLIAAAKQWGVPVAFQVNAPPGITPEQYAARVQAAKAYAPDTLVLDIEAVGSGAPGTPGWEWSQKAAALLKPIVGNTVVAVTMEPHKEDYNYAAYQGLSTADATQFWVQSYTGDNATPAPADWALVGVDAAGVNSSQVTLILAPGQEPPSSGNWASWGIPKTSAGGVYAGYTPTPGAAPPTSPGTTSGPNPLGGDVGAVPVPTTWGLPTGTKIRPDGTIILADGSFYMGPMPTGPNGQPLTAADNPAINNPGSATYPPGPGQPPGSTTTGSSSGGWSEAYFGSFGLPPDVAAKVNAIFQQYPDTDQAIQFALAYIRGTPWYAQTFPGIQYGMQHGIISNENDYRQYVTALETLSQRYNGRHISGLEVTRNLAAGLTPDIVGKKYEGIANLQANGADWNYYLGAFSDQGRLTNVDDQRALGEEQAGLDSPMGQKLNKALQQSLQKYQTLFQGNAATPSLSLGKTGLSAPSLAGGHTTPDVGA